MNTARATQNDMLTGATAQRTVFAVGLAVWIASACVTLRWCFDMAAMHARPMPGGWALSMMWMRMPGQSWLDVLGTFAAMWIVMMIAMMLPSVSSALLGYHRIASRAGACRTGMLTVLAGCGYFLVWSALGVATFVFGAGLAALEIRVPGCARIVPLAAGATVAAVGTLQFTAWKARALECCRAAPSRMRRAPHVASDAWRFGLRLAVQCARCCGPLMLILLAVGMMDFVAMILVTAAICTERLAADSLRATRTVGGLSVLAGMVLMMRACAELAPM